MLSLTALKKQRYNFGMQILIDLLIEVLKKAQSCLNEG